MICVHVRPDVTQIALLEGRTLVEHYVSRAADDTTQIDGNIYRGRVQNVLPGMEAAFIDIGTPKNAVLYHGDVRYDTDDVETGTRGQPRIEQLLRPGQTILCQVTKNPIGAKGARLTQEVSLPGRFVVLVPNSTRLRDLEAPRRQRAAASAPDRRRGPPRGPRADRAHRRGRSQRRGARRRRRNAWSASGTTIAAEAHSRVRAPPCSTASPAIAVRVIREELNREYRAVVIDDLALYEQVTDYVGAVNPELADRVEFYDPEVETLPLFERYHVHEQLHKALDRKVWLPSGGSLVIDRTEALTVIDVNTGKNVGTTNLEETVYRNNLEAAEEVARQLRLRDIGGIIVIDFIDMEIRENRDKVGSALSVGPGQGQDPDPGLRHLRARPGRDDPQAGLGGPDRVALDHLRGLRGARASSSTIRSCRLASPMYAVIKTGGKQERVAEGQELRVELLGEPGTEVTFQPVLVVDGDRVLATPAQLAGSSVTATVVGEELGPKIRGFTYKNKSQPVDPLGSPAALLDHRHHRDHRLNRTPERLRRAAEPRGAAEPSDQRTRTRSSRHVQDQGRRLDPKRAGLERPAPRGEGVRRDRGARRGDPRAPARHQVPPGRRTWAAAVTTRCSPSPTAPCGSRVARGASWSTSSPTDRRRILIDADPDPRARGVRQLP